MDLHNINIGRSQGYNPGSGTARNITEAASTAWCNPISSICILNTHPSCPRLSKPSSSASFPPSLPLSLFLSSLPLVFIRVSMIHSADLACSFSCGQQPVQTRRGGEGEGEHTAALLMQLVKKSISQGRRRGEVFR